MNASQLKPACELSKKFGVKSVIFGAPGSGKTPLINTAPNPVLLVVEPGMLSMKSSRVPTWEAPTVAKIDEFFDWFFKSKEALRYDTLGIDSGSQLAEIYLQDAERKNSHGLKAYGVMSKNVMEIMNALFYMPQKHIVILAKQTLVDNGRQSFFEDGQTKTEPIKQKKPYFPGQDLNVKIPHLFDNVLHLDKVAVQGFVEPQRALRTEEIPEIFARSRVAFEAGLPAVIPADLNQLFQKAMA
jgi:AAA domain